uniref:Uncharacterized protein n=1 Tax=Leersia perrieri TaxID=77586 RepID=A0A0D9V6F2_9ORYZ
MGLGGEGGRIEVRYEGNAVIGCLDEYDLEHEIAFVKVMTDLDVHELVPNHVAEFLPRGKVVSVGCDISGKLMTTDGMLISDSNGREDTKEFMLSTCKISEDWEGGALFDSDENLVGMNLFFVMGRSFFLPISMILERLEYFRTSHRRRKFFALAAKLKAVRCCILMPWFDHISFGEVLMLMLFRRVGGRLAADMPKSLLEDIRCEDQFECLDSMGYPKPSIVPSTYKPDGMVITNTFEETFGNILKVLLPNKKHTEGTLQHCNLHYNVALVSVKNFRALCPANLHHKQGNAGIGGPLVDFDGKYIGINFYDAIVGTPYLSWTSILRVLAHFDEERTIDKVGNGDSPSGVLDWKMAGDRSVRPNSWPVPQPYWCHPDKLPVKDDDSGSPVRRVYGYFNGIKFRYMC